MANCCFSENSYQDLRRQQNLEYEESLRIDQQKDLLKEIPNDPEAEAESDSEPELTLDELRKQRILHFEKSLPKPSCTGSVSKTKIKIKIKKIES